MVHRGTQQPSECALPGPTAPESAAHGAGRKNCSVSLHLAERGGKHSSLPSKPKLAFCGKVSSWILWHSRFSFVCRCRGTSLMYVSILVCLPKRALGVNVRDFAAFPQGFPCMSV